MNTHFITAIYSNLYGTSFGGRPGRLNHYKHSLLSIMKIDNAKFTLYTNHNEINDLQRFFYKDNKISETKLNIKEFDLHQSRYYNSIQKLKNLDTIKQSDRCYEIQYNKFYWTMDEIQNTNYDYYYWIDAGLSYSGLIPNKYLIRNNNIKEYYNSSLFNNKLLDNLISKTKDKLYVIGKDNTKHNFWSQTIAPKYYTKYSNDIHIIGGLFGGKKENMIQYMNLFDYYLSKLLLEESKLYFEELIMSLIYYNHIDQFNLDFFQTWWHEDNNTRSPDFLDNNKSFYKILENLNND